MKRILIISSLLAAACLTSPLSLAQINPSPELFFSATRHDLSFSTPYLTPAIASALDGMTLVLGLSGTPRFERPQPPELSLGLRFVPASSKNLKQSYDFSAALGPTHHQPCHAYSLSSCFRQPLPPQSLSELIRSPSFSLRLRLHY